jgi:hypothetical protein
MDAAPFDICRRRLTVDSVTEHFDGDAIVLSGAQQTVNRRQTGIEAHITDTTTPKFCEL